MMYIRVLFILFMAVKLGFAQDMPILKQAEIAESFTLELDHPEGANPLELVKIKAETFTMGSRNKERGRRDFEWPPHQVTITKDFYLGKYEPTQARYKAFMGFNPTDRDSSGRNRPVEDASFHDEVGRGDNHGMTPLDPSVLALTPTPTPTVTPTPAFPASSVDVKRYLPPYYPQYSPINVRLRVTVNSNEPIQYLRIEDGLQTDPSKEPFNADPPFLADNPGVWVFENDAGIQSIDIYYKINGNYFSTQFRGKYIYRNASGVEIHHPIDGDSTTTPCIAEFVNYRRDLPTTCKPNTPFAVNLSFYGGSATIRNATETIPEGWKVLSADPETVEIENNIIQWNAFLPSITYTVLPASDAKPGMYTFHGQTASTHWCAGNTVKSFMDNAKIELVGSETCVQHWIFY